jgi:hypothetical protein
MIRSDYSEKKFNPWLRNSSANQKKFPHFYGNQRFITVFTTAHQFSPFWVTLIQSRPSQAVSLRSSVILTCHLYLGFPSGFLLSGFTIKNLYGYSFVVNQNKCKLIKYAL